ncbi:hypothetical protein [Anaeropeptidivorans aminofermentans]|uniref:hypothetical protein n=1 Tax=Anaeropeptidivorans aminofermentans TaxID=2934315 RepID=UPI000ED79437|nr:hypothetical protein [Anaeropeptidivorans aminofermentans]MBE6012640.1 hypothetical protein [Lachnospiraceae bacterium]HAQ41121.1 hypothetical protein [Clostridiales bacterium]
MEYTFLDYFNEVLSIRLKEIDILIKCNETISIGKVSELLDISEREIMKISAPEDDFIEAKEILHIMEEGSSEICLMYQREIECNSPYIYSAEEIAYIYGFDLPKVKEAMEKNDIKAVTWQVLPFVFSLIPYNQNAMKK